MCSLTEVDEKKIKKALQVDALLLSAFSTQLLNFVLSVPSPQYLQITYLWHTGPGDSSFGDDVLKHYSILPQNEQMKKKAILRSQKLKHPLLFSQTNTDFPPFSKNSKYIILIIFSLSFVIFIQSLITDSN